MWIKPYGEEEVDDDVPWLAFVVAAVQRVGIFPNGAVMWKNSHQWESSNYLLL